MPKRVPSDAIHTTMTDHRIAARPVFTNPAGEEHKPYSGQVIAFYGEPDDLSVTFANVRSSGADIVALYRRLIGRDPRDPGLFAALGKELLRTQQPVYAVREFEKALTLDPQHTEARMYLGVALALQGKHKDALVQLRRAVRDNPDHSLAWTNLGITLEAMGDKEAAIEAYSEAIRLQPDLSEARQRRARLRDAGNRQ
jgi:Flp pilus assembly protein TadD